MHKQDISGCSWFGSLYLWYHTFKGNFLDLQEDIHWHIHVLLIYYNQIKNIKTFCQWKQITVLSINALWHDTVNVLSRHFVLLCPAVPLISARCMEKNNHWAAHWLISQPLSLCLCLCEYVHVHERVKRGLEDGRGWWWNGAKVRDTWCNRICSSADVHHWPPNRF